MFKKEICIKFSEYKQYEIEEKLKKVNKKDLEKQIIIGGAIALFIINNPTRVMAVDLSGLDVLGETALSIARKIGYWIATLGAITEIIKNGMQGAEKDEIFKTMLKYAIIYGSLFLVPQLFKLIAETLG